MKRGFQNVAVWMCVVFVVGLVETLHADSPSVPSDGRMVDVQSFESLKAENEALRKENQALRRELVARKGASEGEVLPVKAVEPVDAPAAIVGKDTGFWLSNKSHIRHNPKCRNYRKVKGRPCGPNDGRPCKACGG